MSIPLLDLKAQYLSIKEEMDQAVLAVLDSSKFIFGPEMKTFEEEMAAYCGTKHAVAVGNGTDALVIALKACGIGPGDEVITSPFTFFASAESIALVGATPVFVDVEPHTLNMDAAKLEEKITPRTKGIIPCPCLWPDGGYGSHPGSGSKVRFKSNRGCGTSHRGRISRTESRFSWGCGDL